MDKALKKKLALEADLRTLLGIENPTIDQSEKIDRLSIILEYLRDYINKCQFFGIY